MVLIFFILFSYDVSLAQCAMCKATTTSNLEVAMTLRQNGIARSISVKIGFKI